MEIEVFNGVFTIQMIFEQVSSTIKLLIRKKNTHGNPSIQLYGLLKIVLMKTQNVYEHRPGNTHEHKRITLCISS